MIPIKVNILNICDDVRSSLEAMGIKGCISDLYQRSEEFCGDSLRQGTYIRHVFEI